MAAALLDSGDYKGGAAELSSMIAMGQFDAAESLIAKHISQGKGFLRLAKAELALAKQDPDEALSLALSAKDQENAVETLALNVIASAYLSKGKIGEARLAAKDMQKSASGREDLTKKDAELEAKAWLLVADTYLVDDPDEKFSVSPMDAVECVDKAKTLFAELKSAKGQASALTMAAKAHVAREKPQAALDEAKEALGLSRTSGDAKGMVGALEVMVQAYALQGNPVAGLAAANKELTSAGSKKIEAEILQLIANTHATLGEPLGAIKAADKAIDLCLGLSDQMGEASMLLVKSEMLRAQGDKVGATTEAEKALKVFGGMKCKGGEEQVIETLSTVLAERGMGDKAPKRKDALKVLQQMVKVIEKRDAQALPGAEEAVNKMSHLLTDQDYADSLHMMLHADPSAVTFLEGQGWTFKKAGSTEKMRIKVYPHRAFYLQTCMTGMGFGPQFRSVNPHKLVPKAGETPLTISLSNLPPTEEWQMDLLYRPGIFDSGLQVQAAAQFPH